MKKGWETKRIGEICVVNWGNTNLTKKTYITDGKYLACSAAGCDGRINHKEHLKYTPVLSAIGAQCGKMFFPEEDFTAIKNTITLSPKPKLADNKFLFHLLNYIKLPQRGAGQPFISKGDIEKFEIYLPKLSEQKHIVSILDKSFSTIDKAKENIEKNINNSKELFEYYIRDIFTNKKKNWEIKKLGEVAEYFNGLTYSPKDVSDKGIIVLRSSNIQNDELDFSDIVRVSCPVREKIMVREGDILMCSRNGSKRLIGKTATIKNLKEAMTFGTFMMIIRSEYNSYLLWFFKSKEFRKQMTGGENTMINQITRYMLDEAIVVFPPQKEKKFVVKKLDELREQTKKLEKNYQKKLEDLEEMKKSILQKAFNGEL